VSDVGASFASSSTDANGALCAVCEVGLVEVVGLGNAADAHQLRDELSSGAEAQRY